MLRGDRGEEECSRGEEESESGGVMLACEEYGWDERDGSDIGNACGIVSGGGWCCVVAAAMTEVYGEG